jgi:hypothetical protein
LSENETRRTLIRFPVENANLKRVELVILKFPFRGILPEILKDCGEAEIKNFAGRRRKRWRG